MRYQPCTHLSSRFRRASLFAFILFVDSSELLPPFPEYLNDVISSNRPYLCTSVLRIDCNDFRGFFASSTIIAVIRSIGYTTCALQDTKTIDATAESGIRNDSSRRIHTRTSLSWVNRNVLMTMTKKMNIVVNMLNSAADCICGNTLNTAVLTQVAFRNSVPLLE